MRGILLPLGIIVALPGLAALVPPAPRQEPRQIVLVARDMRFHLADDPGMPNPAIRARAGERIRLVLRNEDRGITHDLAVKTLGLALEPLEGPSVGSLEFTVPDRPGRHQYACTPHARMMKGMLEITARGS